MLDSSIWSLVISLLIDFKVVFNFSVQTKVKVSCSRESFLALKDLIFIGRKVKSFINGKNSPSNHSRYLTVPEINNLLSIGFIFKKAVEDLIYKKAICETFNIDIKLNQEIIDRISLLEFKAKINYLINEKHLPLVDASNHLHEIFTMSSLDIQNNPKYNLTLEEIINLYEKRISEENPNQRVLKP